MKNAKGRRRRRDSSERVYEYTLQSPNNGHPRASTGLLAKGRAHAREHKEWARAAAARKRVRVSGVFAARARFVSTVDGFRLWWYNTFSDFHARRAERRVAVDVRLGDVSFVELCFRIYRCTDLQVQVQVQAAYRRVFQGGVSVVVQSGEHHEQHCAVVIRQDARAGAETMSHVLVTRRQTRFPSLLFRDVTEMTVRVAATALFCLVNPFTQRTRARLEILSALRVAVRRALARRSGGGARAPAATRPAAGASPA